MAAARKQKAPVDALPPLTAIEIQNLKANLDFVRDATGTDEHVFKTWFGFSAKSAQFEELFKKKDIAPHTRTVFTKVLRLTEKQLVSDAITFREKHYPEYRIASQLIENGISISLACTREHSGRWRTVFESCEGSWLLYYRRPSDSEMFVVSALIIQACVPHGIAVRIVSPYRGDDDDQQDCYDYTGLMLPLANDLYIFAEQANQPGVKYELFSVVLAKSLFRKERKLKGIALGVDVQGKGELASCECIAIRADRDLDKPVEILLRDVVGVKQRQHVPRSVRGLPMKGPVAHLTREVAESDRELD